MRDTSQLPIKNKFVYCYRVGIKILSFICFGATSVILGVLLLPLMRLCIHPADRFRQVAHLFVSYAFRIGTNILHILGVSSLSFSHKKELKNRIDKFLASFYKNQINRSSLKDGPKVTEISLSPRGDFRIPSDISNL